MAFFPCIYFSALSQMSMSWSAKNYKRLTIRQKTDAILKRSSNRELFFALAVKMLTVAKERGLRLIMENPWSEQTFLKANFIMSPQLIDMDRTLRGDYFKKPTAYFFINCEPMVGYFTEQPDKPKATIMLAKKSPTAGLCSEERSMISPDYARNFICDFLLGKEQPDINPTLFNTQN